MTYIPSIPQQKVEDSDDGQRREVLQEDNQVHRSGLPANIPPSSFTSTISTASTRRSTRQPATLSVTSHTHGVLRSPVHVQHEHSPNGIVEPPPPVPRYDLRNPVQVRPEHELPGTKEPPPPALQELAEAPGPEHREASASHTNVFRTVVPKMMSLMSILFVLAYAYTLTPGRTSGASWCSVPVVSLFCPASRPSAPPPQWADFPRLLNLESGTFEALLDETVKGPGLALELKKAGVATRDLATLVRISNLTSREVLADSLSEFVKDARKVGRGLIRLNSRVGGAVDTIITVNDYALHAIEAASSKSFAPFPRGLWLFPPSASATNQVVTRTFIEAMNTLLINLRSLVLAAKISISDLDKLGEHLGSIHEIVSREHDAIPPANGTMALLWSMVVNGRNQTDRNRKHLVLLDDVSGYRNRALDHVVDALQMLETMAEDMEELRRRVAAPQLVGDAIPIEAHIESLRSGLERLRRIRAGSK
ncbi:hypothetical protein BJV78DRAFT_1151829 [Lactifluus subvellereus]|nr:hypothetical protein BJV78DRAFT_1151829 [Lactifluus subvellereus]